MAKISLSRSNISELLKDIAEDDPILIYYICHLGDSEKFKAHIFDFETDCRKLADKYDITIFIPQRERKTHEPNCRLRKGNELISKELIDNQVCEKFQQFFEQKDEIGNHLKIDREKFRVLFWDNFTFEENPEDIINNELNKIKNEYNISLPPNNYEIYNRNGILITLHYKIKDKEFYFNINVKCNCKNESSKEISRKSNHFREKNPYDIECANCPNKFHISHRFYYCNLYSP